MRVSPLARRSLAVAAASAIALAAAPAAFAADGKWTQLSNFSNANKYPAMSSIDEPTIARFGGNVQVLWSADTSSSAQSYWTAQLDGAGKVTMPAAVAFGGWSALAHNPALISLGGQRFLGFNGLQSTTTGAPYTSGAEYYATSGDGKSWSLGPGSLSSTRSAYASYSNDVVDNAGTPVWIGSASSTTGINWHVGISPTDPAPDGSDGEFRLDGCCGYSGAGARDASTGAVWAAFYSNSSASSEQGIQAGQIVPFAGGFTQAPGSVTIQDGAASSLPPDQRVAMAARVGGGVYVAYSMGYPNVKSIRIWQVGTGNTLDIPGSANAEAVSLAAGPDGRLWVTWSAKDKIKAVHTNASVTKVGAVGSWGAPKGTATIWSTTTSAEAGGLDVAISSEARSAVNVWHTHLTRTLSVNGPATAGRGSSVTFTVSDAGDPVAGARVTFGGRSATTNAQGKATLRAPGGTGGAGVRAAKSGYNTGASGVRVK